MIAEAIALVRDLAQAAAVPQQSPMPRIVDHGGHAYHVTADGNHMTLIKPVRPSALAVHSLDAVVDYLAANRDAVALERVCVHIRGPREVAVIDAYDDNDNGRDEYLVAKPPVQGPTFFGRFMPPDEFVVLLQTQFADEAGRSDLLATVGSLQAEAVTTLGDDGVSQEVTTRKGIKPGREVLKPRHELVAYRSFPEVALPPAPFLVRLRRGGDGELPQVALFEADGGRWVIDALAKIKKYLEPKLPEGVALIC